MIDRGNFGELKIGETCGVISKPQISARILKNQVAFGTVTFDIEILYSNHAPVVQLQEKVIAIAGEAFYRAGGDFQGDDAWRVQSYSVKSRGSLASGAFN
ncbi:hypothetical protein P2W41_14340 [Nitratireductor sp. L15S-10]